MENTISLTELSMQTLEVLKGIGLSDSSLAYKRAVTEVGSRKVRMKDESE